MLGLTDGDRRSFESGAGSFSAPFGFVGVVPFRVLPQEEGAAGEHQDENLLPGFHRVGSNRVESLAFCAIVVFWGPLLCDMQARIRA